MNHHKKTAIALAFAALGAAAPALADTHPALDRVYVQLGAYLADSNAEARLNGSNGILGTDVSFEDDFGLTDDRVVGRARVGFLIGDSQGIEIDGYRFHRSATRSLDRTINYDGSVFDVDAQVHGSLNLDLASVAWRWWLPAGDRDVFGLGLGAAYYRAEGTVAGEATVNNTHQQVKAGDSVDAWAPLVELGWRHAFSDSLRMYADIAGVKKTNGSISGHIYNFALGAEYYPWENIGFGLEYGAQRIHVVADKSRFDGVLNIDLSGPSAFVKARF
ncbi:hypothetical protein [Tahibacter amnicola]|uniref:Opacity protein-like surface antigen n=1 Tax=Tahibacter amnicola TaxID=2976241 RepID=A0ABY6BDH5_9GAMM|nr:hypothetical protein [Tahibacter amnicola]UXI67904.1 hypothetical protein N4264_24775 [Tahibacter amnicola]